MSIEEFLAHLAKTPASGFTWTINEDGCIRAGRSDVAAGKPEFCPITAVIYQLQGIVMWDYQVCWQSVSLGLAKADIANILGAADTLKHDQFTLYLRLELMRAVGLLKPFPNSRRPT